MPQDRVWTDLEAMFDDIAKYVVETGATIRSSDSVSEKLVGFTDGTHRWEVKAFQLERLIMAVPDAKRREFLKAHLAKAEARVALAKAFTSLYRPTPRTRFEREDPI